MARKRVYLNLPSRDYELLRHLGLQTSECPGVLCRRLVLQALYTQLQTDEELQGYDAQLARQEREAVLHGW